MNVTAWEKCAAAMARRIELLEAAVRKATASADARVEERDKALAHVGELETEVAEGAASGGEVEQNMRRSIKWLQMECGRLEAERDAARARVKELETALDNEGCNVEMYRNMAEQAPARIAELEAELEAATIARYAAVEERGAERFETFRQGGVIRDLRARVKTLEGELAEARKPPPSTAPTEPGTYWWMAPGTEKPIACRVQWTATGSELKAWRADRLFPHNLDRGTWLGRIPRPGDAE